MHNFYFSELDSDLPEGYCNPEHLYDIWHLIKVLCHCLTFQLTTASLFSGCEQRYLEGKQVKKLPRYNQLKFKFKIPAIVIPVLSAWQPSITNQMWHAFSSSIGTVLLKCLALCNLIYQAMRCYSGRNCSA